MTLTEFLKPLFKSMIAKKYKLIISLPLALLMGCEGGTTFTNSLDNQSDSDLLVIIHTNTGFIDTVSLHKHSSQTIYWTDEIGRFVPDSTIYSCASPFTSLSILDLSFSEIAKNYHIDSVWTHSYKRGKRNSFESCTATITNDDL
jgi:hypothetical protein